MTGFLRLAGILNAAVWLGASFLFTLAIYPAAFSDGMRQLLGPRNFPYFSEAIAQLFATRYYVLQIVCAGIALLHLLAERLYLGHAPAKLRLSLLITLFALALAGAAWIHPKLKQSHTVRHGVNASPQARQVATEAFLVWRPIFQIANVLTLGGVAIYLWRVANPSDPTRFLEAGKFRS